MEVLKNKDRKCAMDIKDKGELAKGMEVRKWKGKKIV